MELRKIIEEIKGIPGCEVFLPSGKPKIKDGFDLGDAYDEVD